MNPWFGKAAIVLASIVMVVIRTPHRKRSRETKAVKDRKDVREAFLLMLAWVGFIAPLLWVATPVFAFADYPLRSIPFVVGALLLALALWLFHRSHADLGTNWSITLEIREKHQLVTHGIYRRVRHPMYSGLLLYSLGQVLVLPNWVAGPSQLVALGLLCALRLGREERMMMEEFGKDYEAYAARTRRLIPGVW